MMAVQGTKSTGAVHPLTRLSSQGDYVIVDQQASQVLRAARRIDNARSHCGVFYELYFSTKRKAKALLYRPPTAEEQAAHFAATPFVQRPVEADPYDTSDWDDGHNPENMEDFRDAKSAAEYFRGRISRYYPSGHNFDIFKFRIVKSKDENNEPVQDYFLKIKIDALNTKFVFVHINASEDEDGIPKLTLIIDYLRPPPQS